MGEGLVDSGGAGCGCVGRFRIRSRFVEVGFLRSISTPDSPPNPNHKVEDNEYDEWEAEEESQPDLSEVSASAPKAALRAFGDRLTQMNEMERTRYEYPGIK